MVAAAQFFCGLGGVPSHMVCSFLGRLYTSANASLVDSGRLPVFNDTTQQFFDKTAVEAAYQSEFQSEFDSTLGGIVCTAALAAAIYFAVKDKQGVCCPTLPRPMAIDAKPACGSGSRVDPSLFLANMDLVDLQPAHRPVAHQTLQALVESGRLKLSLLIGPARTGSTATERLIYTELGFDGNYNQPGLLGQKCLVKDPLRDEYVWQRVLDKVRRLTAAALATGRDLDTEPITLLIKETANIVLPGREHYLYRELGCQTISVVRSPLLQLESRIGCILLRIEDAALQGLGFHPDKIDPRTFTVAGEPLIRPNADLTHLDFGPFAAQSLWVQHQKHMKRTRDYSSLGKGFVRFCNYHPLFEDPVAQKIIWGCYAREHPDQVDQALIDEFVGTTLDRMECLPAPLAQALFEWDISWTPFRLLFNECPDSVIVSDFADTQTDGGKALLAATRRAVDHTTSLANTYDFDLCSDGENWDQWYIKSCDWGDCLRKTHLIDKQKRGPAPPSKFPREIVALFEPACATYMAARSHPNFVPQVAVNAGALVLHVDCTYAYMRADDVDTQANAVRNALRRANPDFAIAFDAIDAARR